MTRLPSDVFKEVVRNAPLVAIDLVILNEADEILLGRRKNKPAAGFLFVPGGRILKDESIASALRRISETEVGFPIEIAACNFIGVFEHRYADNYFDDPDFDTYYVVLGFQYRLLRNERCKGDEQHTEFRFLPLGEARINPEVHDYTKAYLGAGKLAPAVAVSLLRI